MRTKGIERGIIDEAFENIDEFSVDGSNEASQIELIRKLIVKKLKPGMDVQTENKLVMSVVRKGFMFDDVISVLKEEKNTRFSV